MEILDETPGYSDVYDMLFQESFFELEGVNGEYVRLNEVIHNYVSRAGFKILPKHRQKAQEIFEKIFLAEDTAWYNATEFLLATRETVKQGKKINPIYMIPSVYLKSMSDLYANMQYEDVVGLAQRFLEHMTEDSVDSKVVYEVRYLLCSALAKLKNSNFLNEVTSLKHNEVTSLKHDDKLFLQAFYYRQIGKPAYALSRLNELLEKRPDMSKAKREKVVVLKNLQQFEEAMDLAKENYILYSDNPYHIQAYFECLINTYYKNPQSELLSTLIDKIERIPSEKAQSMCYRCKAQYLAYVDHDYNGALQQINETVTNFPRDKKYALIVKFDIAQHFKQIEIMQETIEELELERANSNNIVICKSKLLATQGKIDETIQFFSKNILFFTEESKTAFCDTLKSYSL